MGAAAEAIGEILRRDARSERRSSEEEKAEEGFNGISGRRPRPAGVAGEGEAGKAARFMMPPAESSSRGCAAPRAAASSGQCGRRGCGRHVGKGLTARLG